MKPSFLAEFRRGAPIGRRAAARLLNRLSFGGTRHEVDSLAKLGAKQAVRRLLPLEPKPSIAKATRPVGSNRLEGAQAWWLEQMTDQENAVRERIALLWHDHFACTIHKPIPLAAMLAQNEVFRVLGLDSFAQLVQEVMHGPAMQLMLDGPANSQSAPNENLAREILELFCLRRGDYQRSDVRELARSLTGLATSAERVEFHADLHDGGQKVLLGVHGQFRSREALDVVLGSPACAQAFVERICMQLVGTVPTGAERDELVARSQSDGLRLEALLRRLGASEALLGEGTFQPRLAGPAELAASIVRRLGLSLSGTDIVDHVTRAGQSLFAPPGVDGWPFHTQWSSSTWSLRRAELAFVMLARCDPASIPNELRQDDPVEWIADVFGVNDATTSEIQRAGAKLLGRGARGTACAARLLALPVCQRI